VQANTGEIMETYKSLVAGSKEKPSPLETALIGKVEELAALCQRRNQQLRGTAKVSPQEEYELAANSFFFVLVPNLLLWALREHGLFPGALYTEVSKLSETGQLRILPAGQAAWTALAGWAVAADVDPAVSLPATVSADDALTAWSIFAERMLLVTQTALPRAVAAVQVHEPGWAQMKQVDLVKLLLGYIISMPEYADGMRQAMYTSLQATTLDPKTYEREPLFTWSRVVLQHLFADPRLVAAICGHFDQQFKVIAQLPRTTYARKGS
jgi:hypothetical protein